MNIHSRNFQKKIREYNSALAFTSIGVKINEKVTGTAGVYSFWIQGETYYQIGFLLPKQRQFKFTQLYIYDTDHELTNCHNIISNLNSKILKDL